MIVDGVAEGPILIETTVHSAALVGNFLGDSPDREVNVCLPPGYEADTSTRYPVLYLLHGYPGERGGRWEFIGGIADRLIGAGNIHSLIIVAPHSRAGCFYVNSSATGNWADFIAHDLVSFVDAEYRTIAEPSSRGIAGHSMGGYGAMSLAMSRSDVYGAVYSLSGVLGSVGGDSLATSDAWPDILDMIRFPSGEDFTSAHEFVLAAVWSPNPNNPPLYVDLPVSIVDGRVVLVDAVVERWQSLTPVGMLEVYAERLRRMTGVKLDIGTDDWLLDGNREFSSELTDRGVPHVFEEYDGDHGNRLVERAETHVLPWFSETLRR
jgi:S-formylglutathione hydrolase